MAERKSLFPVSIVSFFWGVFQLPEYLVVEHTLASLWFQMNHRMYYEHVIVRRQGDTDNATFLKHFYGSSYQ